jgi:hypothetical protein
MARKTRKAKNIFLRGSIWWIRYSDKGRQIRESSESTVFDDADRLLKKRQGEVVTGKFAGLGPERVTMAELLVDVEQDYRDNGRTSLPQLLSRLKRLKPAFGNIRAAEFSSDHLKRYRSGRLQDGAKRAAINREVEILARAWSLAQQCDPPKVTRPFHFPMFEENNTRPGGRRMPMFGPMRECLSMQKAIRDEKFPDCPYVYFRESGGRMVDFQQGVEVRLQARRHQ